MKKNSEKWDLNALMIKLLRKLKMLKKKEQKEIMKMKMSLNLILKSITMKKIMLFCLMIKRKIQIQKEQPFKTLEWLVNLAI